MIPPRMLSNETEIFGTGNGLRNRVTACRKRIRINRFHRTQVIAQPGERLLESVHGVSDLPGYLKDAPTVRCPFIHAPDLETSQPGAEQEVGIT